MGRKIANLIERIPGGHLEYYAVVHVWHVHRYAENMFFGVSNRDGVINCCARRAGGEEQDSQRRGPFPMKHAATHP